MAQARKSGESLSELIARFAGIKKPEVPKMRQRVNYKEARLSAKHP